MDLDQISFNLKAYKEHNQILDAANFVVHQFGHENKDFEGFGFQGRNRAKFYFVIPQKENLEKLGGL
jgi:hypothetical protein